MTQIKQINEFDFIKGKTIKNIHSVDHKRLLLLEFDDGAFVMVFNHGEEKHSGTSIEIRKDYFINDKWRKI